MTKKETVESLRKELEQEKIKSSHWFDQWFIEADKLAHCEEFIKLQNKYISGQKDLFDRYLKSEQYNKKNRINYLSRCGIESNRGRSKEV